MRATSGVDGMKADILSEGQLVATVAHEVKAPLHVIETIARSARMGAWGKPTKALSSQLNRMEMGARSLLELADSLLRLEQINIGSLDTIIEPVDSDSIIDQALVVAEPFARARGQTITKSKHRSASLPVLADRLYVRHALLNILLNASRYSPVGAVISIKYRQKDGVACFEVSDEANRLGRDAKRQVNTAAPLNIYNHDDKGYGMGLFIASRFIQSCDGWVDYSERRGRGNRFVLCLPAARQLSLFQGTEK